MLGAVLDFSEDDFAGLARAKIGDTPSPLS